MKKRALFLYTILLSALFLFGNIPLSFAQDTNILTFSLGSFPGTITPGNVAVTVDFDTDLSAIATNFTLSSGATADFNDTPISSGDPWDFSDLSETMTVTADDGITEQDWVINVSRAPNTETAITSFDLDGFVGSITPGNIAVTVDFDTDLSAIATNFVLSAEATADFNNTPISSGDPWDFSDLSETMTVTAGDGVTEQDWVINVSRAPNTETAITSFDLDGFVGSITPGNIAVTVDFDTDLSAIATNFVLSAEATADFNNTPISSGDPWDFSDLSETMTVTAGDGITEQDWVINVSRAPNTETAITSFDLDGFVGSITPGNIAVTVDFDTDLSAIATNFVLSAGATADFNDTPILSGNPWDFSDLSETMTVTAGDGITEQDWVINVSRAPNTETAITSFDLDGFVGSITPGNIAVTVDFDTDLSAIATNFVLSAGATADFNDTPILSGNPWDFSDLSETMTVTAGDGITEQDWVINVSRAPNTETAITSFDLDGFVGSITPGNIAVTVDFDTDLSAIATNFVLSAGATADFNNTPISSGDPWDFSDLSETMTVTAGDGVTEQDWVINVSRAPNTTNDILTYSIGTNTGVVNASNHTVAVTVPFGTNVTNLVATFTLSPQATATVGGTNQVSGTTANNFTNPVIYAVRSGSGATQNWTVTVSIAPNTANDILTYSIGTNTGVVNATNHTVAVTVPFGTNVTNLVATFTLSPQATATVGGTNQVSGTTPNNFTNPVIYAVRSGSGATQNWTVTVSIAPNTANDILTYSIGTNTGVVNATNHTVAVTVPFGTNITNLVATFTLSPQATATVGGTNQVSGTTANNFTNPVTYAVRSGSGATQNWTVTVSIAPNTANDILTYSIGTNTGVVNATNHTVAVTVPFGTNVTNLVATFTLSPQATATVGGTNQVSGTTPNNFTNPVIYAVRSGSGATQNWTVTVSIAPNTANDILTYSIGTNTGVVNATNHTVAVTVPFGTNVTNLVATFTLSPQATATVGGTNQVSGTTPNNFTNPVTYAVRSGSGATQNWTVTVSIAPNTANDILTYSIGTNTGVVNATNHTVAVTVPFGTNVTNLVATFTLSPQATATVGGTNQVSGTTPNNFTNPVTYAVRSGSGATQNWTVTVSIAPNTANDILTYSIGTNTGVVNATNHTVAVTVPFGTNITNLVATFTLSPQATATVGGTNQVSGTTPNNFTNPVTYAVRSGSGATQNWTVTVSIAPNTANDILTYSIGTNTGVVNATNHTVAVTVPFGTNVTNLVATFTLSPQATATVGGTNQVSGTTPNNFTNPVTYAVRSGSGATQNWTVTVSIAPNTANDILTYSIGTNTGVVNATNHTVAVTVPFGTNITNLVATFTLSPQATATVGGTNQVSGTTALDFTNPITYAVRSGSGSTQNWTVTVSIAPNTANDILTYSIGTNTGVVNATNHTVAVTVPFGTNVTNLVATFTLSPQATATVGGTNQVSGTTANNFTNPVTYAVRSGSGATQNWTVTVSIAPNTANDILTYSIGTNTGVVNATNHTVAVTVPFGTNVTNLVATFTLSPQATATVGGTNQVSSTTANNFTNPVIYAVRSGSGATQNWTVTVSIAPNTETDILTFSVDGFTGTVNAGNHTVSITVPYGTNVSSMVTTFTLSDQATARVSGSLQESGVSSLNFASPVTYTITAGDGTTSQDWVVTVNIAPNTATDFEAYSFPEQTGPAVINTNNHTIFIQVQYGTDVTDLVASFALSFGATTRIGGTLQTSGVTSNDFSGSVIYRVLAEDGTTAQNWTVTVSVAPNFATDIITFSIPGEAGSSIVNSGSHSVVVVMPYGSDISNLVVSFTLSPGATATIGGVNQVSGATANDFTSEVIYTIRAENGLDNQDWTVQVSIAPNTSTGILLFSFNEISRPSIIDFDNHTINAQVVYGTDVNSLVAIFVLSEGATARVSGVLQVSGSTANDFSSPVTYTVTAMDGTTTQDWLVTVSIAPNTEADFLAFSFPEQTGPATIDGDSLLIDIEVDYGTDLTSLVASFSLSDNASSKIGTTPQTSSVTVNDFSSEVTYIVTSEDGSTIKPWVVRVSVADNTEIDILSYSFDEQTGDATIDDVNHTIDIEVSFGSDITNLVGTFTLSPGASASVGPVQQESGVTSNDFTSPITYIVTAMDSITSQDWTVSVTVQNNNQAEILTFSFPEQTGDASIVSDSATVDIEVAYGTDLTGLIASFTLSPQATASVGGVPQVSDTTANDFSSPVVYSVSAGDGSTKDWTVTVTVEGNSENDFLTYSLPGQTSLEVIDTANNTIDIEIAYTTDLDSLIATFTLSSEAIGSISGVTQESGITPNDFTDTLTYTVTAGDQSKAIWEIRVTVLPNNNTDFLSYSLPNQIDTADIDYTLNEIYVIVEEGIELNQLVASFELSAGVTASVNSVVQVSGTTANDFTEPVIYTLRAQDQITTQNWIVYVSNNFEFHYVEEPNSFPSSRETIQASTDILNYPGIDKVTFHYKKVEEDQWTALVVFGKGRTFEIDITKTMIGKLGIYYYFDAIDTIGNYKALDYNHLVMHYDSDYPQIPDLRFGESVNHYQIIAIPLDLTNSNAEAVFDELGEYNIKQWRLFHYDGISSNEYKSGFDNINPGLGYWLIAREETTITTGAGSTVRIDSIDGFEIDLHPGWNQIGNPFDMDISWNDVILDNNNLNIGTVRLFNRDSLSAGNIIPRYRGGFVFLDGVQPITVNVRPSQIGANARKQPLVNEDRFNSLDQASWIAGLKISNGMVTNTLSGIGMHPEAVLGKDLHDEVLMPVPKEIIPFQLAFNHPEEKYNQFSLDVIPSTDQYIWEFDVKSFGSSQKLTISWNNKHFGDNEFQLLLNHKGSEKLINMKEVNSYSFNSSGSDQFRIVFGDEAFVSNELKPQSITFGNGYPNPFRDQLTIPLTLPESDSDYMVNISIYDLKGNMVKKLVNENYTSGYYEVNWNSLEDAGVVSRGIYIIKMAVRSDDINTVITRKVIQH